MELLRDRRPEFDEVGVQPVGISRDSPYTHIAWTQALDLNFGLLSDFNGEAVRGFGIGFEFRGFHDVAQRSAFLIDEDGVIRNALELRDRRCAGRRRVARGRASLESRRLTCFDRAMDTPATGQPRPAAAPTT